MKLLLVTLLAFLMAGCATAEQRQAAYASKCSSYGFKEGTQEFASCMMQSEQIDAQRRFAMGMALRQSANTMARPAYIPQQPTPLNTNTNCQMIGNQMLCNSTTR